MVGGGDSSLEVNGISIVMIYKNECFLIKRIVFIDEGDVCII